METEAESTHESILTLPPEVDITRNRIAQLRAAIADMRNRDDEAARTAASFQTIRRSVALEVRRENWEKAVQAGELRTLILSLFMRESYDCAMEVVRILQSALDNITAHPQEPKYRRLKSSNPLVARKIMPFPGALELLVPLAKFSLDSDGLKYDGLASELEAPVVMLKEITAALEKRESCERRKTVEIARSEREAVKRAEMPNAPTVCTAERDPSKKRVSVAQAIQYLLGKNNDDGDRRSGDGTTEGCE